MVLVKMVIILPELSPYLIIVFAPSDINKQDIVEKAHTLLNLIDPVVDVRNTTKLIEDRLQAIIGFQYRCNFFYQV